MVILCLVAGSEAEGPLLTDEDRTLLERWKSIYLRSSQTVLSDDCRSTVSVADPVDQHSSERQSPSLLGLTSSNTPSLPGLTSSPSPNLLGLTSSHSPTLAGLLSTDCCLQGQVINNTSFLSSDVQPSLQPNETNSDLSVFPSLAPSAVAFPGCLPPTDIQSSFVSLLTHANNNVHHVKHSAAILTSVNLSECGQYLDREDVTGSRLLPPYNDALQARTQQTLLATSTPLFGDSNVTREAVDARFLHHNQLSEADAVPTAWVCDGVERTSESKMGELATVEVVGELCVPRDGDHVTSRLVNNSFTRSETDDLRVITSRLMKSHVEDLTLHNTPRGSGAGYGVGCYELEPTPSTADLPSAHEET